MKPTERKFFNKLVRDKVPELILKSGKNPKFSILPKENRKEALINKLKEEVDELHHSESPENALDEIVDVYEVLMAIVYEIGYMDADMFLRAKQKKREKGAFDNFVILEEIT